MTDRYEPHCDCLGGHVSMLPDPNGRWCRATDPRAVATQPALGYDPDCPECKGTGQRDSGGTHPWGEPAMMMCDCDAPQHPVADAPSGIVQQMPEGGDEAIKPCPFCGCDKVAIFYDHPESVGPSIGGGFYISHPLWRDYPQTWRCEAVPNNGYFQTKQEAIAAWNRRATDADLRAEVDRLQKERDKDVLAEKMRMMDWCAKRQKVSTTAWERAARKALAGDMSDLRTRIALIDAGPLDVVQSAALYPETDGGQDG